jgi:hypothetical protein
VISRSWWLLQQAVLMHMARSTSTELCLPVTRQSTHQQLQPSAFTGQISNQHCCRLCRCVAGYLLPETGAASSAARQVHGQQKLWQATPTLQAQLWHKLGQQQGCCKTLSRPAPLALCCAWHRCRCCASRRGCSVDTSRHVWVAGA